MTFLLTTEDLPGGGGGGEHGEGLRQVPLFATKLPLRFPKSIFFHFGVPFSQLYFSFAPLFPIIFYHVPWFPETPGGAS